MSFQPNFDFVEELRWRGLLHDAMPGTQELLNSEQVTGYVGFDPTADSLHIGNLVPITQLMHFQRAGHIPVALVGGATGMVGDPSGKTDERKLLDVETINHNIACQKAQLAKFIDFGEGGNKAKLVNNYDWFKNWSFLEFIRDVGKHITVSYMMGKDSVRNRLESGGISFTEFTYQLVQGYDFLHLYKNHGCKLQMGGSDQWGNIVAGLDLIRKVSGGTAHAFTIPLMAKSDGSKFGKTASGAIWLDSEMTSPYAFFQFWVNADDADVEKFLKTFSFKSRVEIESLLKLHEENPGKRDAHRALARELTSLVHGDKAAQHAEIAAAALFGQGELSEVDEETLRAALSQLPKVELDKKETIPTWIDLASTAGIVKSKSDARRIIKEGGAYLNNQKISGEDFAPNKNDLITFDKSPIDTIYNWAQDMIDKLIENEVLKQPNIINAFKMVNIGDFVQPEFR